MAFYRQWKLCSDTIIDNPLLNDSIYQYTKMTDMTKQILKDNEYLTIMTDDNIDNLQIYLGTVTKFNIPPQRNIIASTGLMILR